MVQGYYTLQEAAKYLNISLDELKKLAQKGQIRSFQDRGTLRFRIQDIQELARQRGISSDPDLVLGEASLPPKKSDGPRSPKSPKAPKSSAPPPAGPKTPPREQVPEIFDFEFDSDETVALGGGPPSPGSAAKKAPSGGKPKSAASPKSGIQPRSANVPQSKAQPKSATAPKSSGPPRSGTTPKSGIQPRSSSATSATRPHAPAPGSDSDSKLVGGSDEAAISVSPDSDIKLREKSSSPSPKSPPRGGSTPKSADKGTQPPTTNPVAKRPSQFGPRSPSPADSGVRLVPMDSDSDVKIVSGDEVPLGEEPPASLADSNVRLEKVSFPPRPEDAGSMLTDEINLDEELRKEEERRQQQPKRPSKVKPKSELKFPTTSPFELSDADLDAPPASAAKPAPAPADSSDFELAAAPSEGSSNFDLTPAKDDSSNFDLSIDLSRSSLEIPTLKDDSSGNFELTPSKDEATELTGGSSEDDFSLELSDDDVNLGGGELTAPASGINLRHPTDAGISLEDKTESDDSLEFDLSLEPEATPRPAQMKEVESGDGSSEFELSLELGDSSGTGGEGGSPADSDSEFELTLDDSGELGGAAAEDAPQVKAGGDEEETQDIFESDFDIPALQEDAAEPATVDTELESSDFDLALDDSELAADEESGSQVVALDEEEVEPVGEEEEIEVTDLGEEGGFGDLEGEEEVVDVDADDTRPARVEVREKLLRPAPWGVLPTIVMFPCVIVMLLVGLVGFEVVQSSLGHRPPGLMTRALNNNVLQPLGVTQKPL